MQQNILASKLTKSIILACIAACLIYLYGTLGLRNKGDDQFFLMKFYSDNIIHQVIDRYMTWSGRFAPDMLMFSTIGYFWFWKGGILLAVFLTCFSIARIIDNGVGNKFYLFTLTFVLFMLIPYQINRDGSWWAAGFYNYLLPISMALYAFSVISSRAKNKVEMAIALSLAFYFPYVEQVGISFIISIIALMFTHKYSRTAFSFILLAISALNFSVCMISPGNSLRYAHEIWHWFPQYQTYSLINKLSLGFDKLHQAMTMPFNMPVITLACATFSIGLKINIKRSSVFLSLIFIASFVLMSLSKSIFNAPDLTYFFFSKTINSDIWASGRSFLSYLYLLIAISSMIFILIVSYFEERVSLMPISALLIGFMTITMMGLTPTVYGSGLRVDLVFEVMCILSSVYLINSLSVNKVGIK